MKLASIRLEGVAEFRSPFRFEAGALCISSIGPENQGYVGEAEAKYMFINSLSKDRSRLRRSSKLNWPQVP